MGRGTRGCTPGRSGGMAGAGVACAERMASSMSVEAAVLSMIGWGVSGDEGRNPTVRLDGDGVDGLDGDGGDGLAGVVAERLLADCLARLARLVASLRRMVVTLGVMGAKGLMVVG